MSEQAYTPRKCTKHDPYWETVYANCMACRAEKAEQQLQAIQATVGDTEFALRARVAELESKEIALKKHIELIQARLEHEVNRPAKLEDDIAQLQAALATVTAERDAVRVAKNDCVIELYRKLDVKDEQLAASQARCREMERDKEQAVYALGQLEEKYLQLQATLAAREARIQEWEWHRQGDKPPGDR